MKLGLGLYPHLLTSDNFRFAKQAGATHIVAHIPNAKARSKSGDAWGVTDENLPYWTYDDLRGLKAVINAEGLALEALENFKVAHWHDVLLDGPRKQEQLENLKLTIRNMGGRASLLWATTSVWPAFGGVSGGPMREAAHYRRATWQNKRCRTIRFPMGLFGTQSTMNQPRQALLAL